MTLFRTPLLATALLLACSATISRSVLAQTQVPVDANPAPPPTAPANPVPTAPVVPMAPVAPPAPALPPTAGSVIAAPPAQAGASPSVAELNQAARDPRTLNWLLIPTDNEISTALENGRAFGKSKQDFIDLLTPARRPFQYRNGGMLGERRRPTGVVVWMTPDMEALWRGYIENRRFAAADGRDADFKAMREEVTSPQRTLTFIVEIGGLISGHRGDPSQAELDAGATSLNGTRFVLSDDHDNNYDPLNVAASQHLMNRQDFYDALSSGPDRLIGNAAFTAPSPESHSLVLRRKPYGDYAAFYIVTFNAFNSDGAARVNRDVHTLTLRIITPEEPKFAVFDVDKMP